MSEVQNVEGKEKEDWMQQKWRPMMGWMYMGVCVCDFVIFPVLWSLHQAVNHGQVSSQWQPLTLNGAGLFHMAMGAVLGIAAYGRTQEKMAGAAGGNGGSTPGGFNNGSQTMGGASTFSQPQAGGFSGPAPSFGSTSTAAPSFNSPAPAFGTSGANCPNTGKPLGPDQSFPAL